MELGSGPLKIGPLGLVREGDCERDGGSWRAAVGPWLNRPTRLGIGPQRSGPNGKRERESEEGGIQASIC